MLARILGQRAVRAQQPHQPARCQGDSSAYAFFMASAPWNTGCAAFSAAAMPLEISTAPDSPFWRFIGMARNTPSAAVKTVKAATTYHGVHAFDQQQGAKLRPNRRAGRGAAAVAVTACSYSPAWSFGSAASQIERMAFQITKDSSTR